MHPPASMLAADLDRLGADLLRATRELFGPRLAELVHRLRDDAAALRAGRLTGGRSAFAAGIGALPLDDVEDVARAFTHWCHLMNAAEEQQRVRVLRGVEAGGAELGSAVRAMSAAGMTADEVEAWFERALVMPVITAHPTEARRRSILDHLGAIALLLDGCEDDPRGDRAEELSAEVLALLGTEEARARKPTPMDEIESAVEVFRRTLFEVTADVYADLEDALASCFPGRAWRLPSFFRWGTWVGGDRDGNPNVTAQVTRVVFERQRAAVLARYLQDVDRLGRALSVASHRAADPAGVAALEESLERDRVRLPEVAARVGARTAHEPWREKLFYMAARLRATAVRGDDAYVDVAGYSSELALIERTLDAAGFGRLARGHLRACRRRAEVFGFHLATVDIRQHSQVHEAVVDELLAASGRPGYRTEDEDGRRRVLAAVLAAPVLPARDRTRYSETTQDTLATLDVAGLARRELGARACERYVVSFTSDLSDLLEVVFLTRVAGLAPGELRPVPLLEQLEDLARAGELARAMVDDPIVRGEIGGELEVMLGYSDSGKQVGYLASAVALRTAQIELAAVAEQAAMTLTVFHGRGGAIGRGGGPAGEAIRAQPATALRGRIRVTEQGETVTARYARPVIAHRDLELTLGAVLRSAADQRGGVEPPIDDAIALAAAAALGAYRRLTADTDRLARYTLAATPIQHVGKLPIGSRPASRKAGFSLDDLRAIPWVFSWNQSRHGIPGWFGVGSGLEALSAGLGLEAARDLIHRSRFLRALAHNVEMALIRADIDVAREYANLGDRSVSGLFPILEEEHARTVGVLAALDLDSRLTDRPYLAESVWRRNPYLDVLSHCQIELLRRFRAAEAVGAPPEELARLSTAIFTTISGLAAGLQTAG